MILKRAKFVFIIVALIGSLLITITTNAMAWRCGMGMGGGGWCPNNFLPFWASNLTAEQSEKLTATRHT